MPSTEFLKIKEKQKAFGMNNGLRVHEVFDRIFTIFMNFQFRNVFLKSSIFIYLNEVLISARFL